MKKSYVIAKHICFWLSLGLFVINIFRIYLFATSEYLPKLSILNFFDAAMFLLVAVGIMRNMISAAYVGLALVVASSGISLFSGKPLTLYMIIPIAAYVYLVIKSHEAKEATHAPKEA